MTSTRVQLPVIVLIQVLAISCWFNTAAAVPGITQEYSLSAFEGSILTVGVQLGFAVGAIVLALLRAPDRLQPRLLVELGALLAAMASIAPVVLPMSFPMFSATRMLVGLALAAVYTTGMRVVLSWVAGRMRGFAVASLVAALTMGTALPHLVASVFVGDWRPVLVVTAAAAILSAGLSCLVLTGPHISAVRPAALHEAVAVLRNLTQLRISAAYLGHMWEIYGMWVWVPQFLAVVVVNERAGGEQIGMLSFAVIGLAGVAGSTTGAIALRGWSRWGVSRVALLLSGVFVIVTPVLGILPTAVSLAILMFWGAVVIADSALYSAMTGDESGQAAVGTAIALQMGLGYGLSIVAIVAVPLVAELLGWEWAFLILLSGPVVGYFMMRRPTASSSSVRLAQG